MDQFYEVVIEFEDGGFELRSGGTRAWRNNNPGNLRNYAFSQEGGSIGEAGGFAVFPDEVTGHGALSDLLHTQTYQDLTVGDAISRFAPPVENNTAAYQANIHKLTGLEGTRSVGNLGVRDVSALIRGIRQIEGWRPGTVSRY